MKTILLSFLLITGACSSQVDLRSFDYSKADSIALSFPKKKKYKTTEELTLALTAGLTTEQEKFRVIFRWITANVAYSYSNSKEDPKKAMNSKKAVCIGYSTLLKEMCGTVGISCPVITGDARNETKDIGNRDSEKHAWNKVFLNGEWHLVDVTWASGYFDDKKRKFTPAFNEFYFLTPPENLINNHFPENKSDQFIKKPVSFRKYLNAPLKHPDFYTKAGEKYKEKGLLKTSTKKPLVLTIPLKQETQNIILFIDENRTSGTRISKDEKGNYVLEQKIEKPGEYEAQIFVDGKLVVSHRLKVR